MGELQAGFQSRLRRHRARLLRRSPGDPILLGLGAAVGATTGLLAALLIVVIQWVQELAWGTEVSTWKILLVPTLGALLVGVLVTYVVPESRASGIVQTMTTIALGAGRSRARVPLGGIAASGIALGTGASGGREGPVVLIGGSVGSLAGRLFAVDEEGKRALIAAGAAAGIGASFNAPIGGMLFAIELLLGGFRARWLQVVVLASVTGSVTAREIIGPGIIYRPQISYTLRAPRELLLYALLSVGAAAFALAFIYGEQWAGRFFERLRVWPPVRLALGGLGVGLIALAVPEVLGTGADLPPIDGVRDPIQQMLDGGFGEGWGVVGLLLLLAVAKVAATCLSIGSGNAVGTFAPALFAGAALGGAFGSAADALPGLSVQPGAFALVGMAAVFSAAAHAPLTSILIAFELTGDYGLVLPLMLTCGVATFLAERVQPESLYTLQLRRRGIVYAEPTDIDVMQTVRVGEIMVTDPATVTPDTPLDDVADLLERTRSHGVPVVRGDRLVGVVAISDLARAPDRHGAVVSDVCTRRVLTVTPDDPAFRALRRMASADVGRLPVVAAHDHSHLVGLVRRADLVQAYQRALTRSLGAQQRRATSRLRDLADASFAELVVDGDAEAAGRAVRDVGWPPRTILVGVHREGELLMPNGDTVLQAGDEVTVLTAGDGSEQVRHLLVGKG